MNIKLDVIEVSLHHGDFRSSNHISGAVEGDIETIEVIVNGVTLYNYTAGCPSKDFELKICSAVISKEVKQ